MVRYVLWSLLLTSVFVTVMGGAYSFRSTEELDRLKLCEDIVQRVQSISRRWSTEVSNIRSQAFFNYDRLVDLSAQSGALLEELKEHGDASPHASASLKRSMRKFMVAVSSQSDQVERFKLAFSALHNSVRYLPIGLAQARSQIMSARDEDREAGLRVLSDIDALASSITLFRQTRVSSDLQLLQSRVDVLRSRASSFQPEIGALLRRLLAHGQVVITQSDDVFRSFDKVTSPQVLNFGDALVTNLRVEHDRHEVFHRYAEIAFYVCGVLICLVWLRLLGIGIFLYFKSRRDRRLASIEREVSDSQGSVAAGSVDIPEAGFPVLKDRVRVQAPKVKIHVDGLFPAAPSGLELSLAGQARSGALEGARLVEVLRSLLAPLVPDQGMDPEWGSANDLVERVRRPAVRARCAPGSYEVDLRVWPAVSHLLVNALLSGGSPGSVSLSVASVTSGVVVSVRDEGAGMDSSQTSTAMSLFHTTRDSVLGLGLPAALQVCQLITARLVLRSSPGEGTVARILIPHKGTAT